MLGSFLQAKDIGNFERFIKVLESAKNLGDGVYDVLPVIFVLTNGFGEVLKANRLAQQFFALPEEDLLGRNLCQLVPKEAAATLTEIFAEKTRASTSMRELETRHTDASGEERFTFWNVGSVGPTEELAADIHIVVASDVTLLRKNHQRLVEVDREIAISKAIQDNLLPAASRFENERFRIRGYYRAADSVSGDWWWYELKSDGALNLLLGDVTGHGIGAAMVTAKVASAYSVISRKAKAGAAMKELLEDLNATVSAANDGHSCVSLFGLRCDPATDQAELCFCGCNPVMIARPGAKPTICQQGGRFLGWRQEPMIGQLHVPLLPGDRLFACTDGMFEFKDERGKPFSVRKLFQLVESLGDLDIDALCEALVSRIGAMRGEKYHDDMSFVVVERK